MGRPIATLAVFAALVWPMPGAAQLPTYDVLIANGRVLDGSGNPWFAADVGIRGDRVVAVGALERARAARVIDAAGLIVAPGFIDVHSHAVGGLAGSLNTALPLLSQGITTAFINPDGAGPTDLAAQRAQLEGKGIGVNVAQFVPHGAIRSAVVGLADRAPTGDELNRMIALVRAGMAAGGIGLSSGLYYAPGSYATTEEVVALAKVVAEFGGAYSSHIRDEADYSVGVVAAVQEVIRIAEEAHLPGIVSHIKALGPAQWGLATALTTRIEQARSRGVQVYADQYPYEASGTSLSAALVPRWAQSEGDKAFLTRLEGADRDRIRSAIVENLARRGGPDTLVISDYAPEPALEGKSLAAIAAERRTTAVDLVVALLARGDGGLVSFNMSEADIVQLMKQPWTMTCTDGDLSRPGQGKPHPRGYGAFARKLGVYVRERGVLGLADAVRSMTSLPAQVFGIKDRGVIRPGARADVVVFDPSTIRDTATYASPQQLAVGVHAAVVNGVPTILDSRPTGATPGRVLRLERR